MTINGVSVGLQRPSTGGAADSTIGVHASDDGTPTLHRDELLVAIEALVPALAVGATRPTA